MRPLFWIGVLLIAAWAVGLVLLGFPDGIIHAVPVVGLFLITADWVTQRGNPLDRNAPLPGTRMRGQSDYDDTLTRTSATAASRSTL